MLIVKSTAYTADYRVLNAINSWERFASDIILFGIESVEAAQTSPKAMAVTVERNEALTPLVSDMFNFVPVSSEAIHIFANSDIMLFFVIAALAKVEDLDIGDSWLMVGQRKDMDIQERIDFEHLDLLELCEVAAHYPYLPPCGADYFIWRNVDWFHMPPFAVGRLSYDNWIIYDALKRHVPIIDATRVILAIHQNHPEREGVRTCPEARENFRLAKESYPEWTAWNGWINHATYRLE